MQHRDWRSQPDTQSIAALRERYPVERTVDLTLTSKLERRASGPGPKVDIANVGDRLQAFLERRVRGDIAIRKLAPLTGGASKEQFAFELDWTRDGERRTGDRMVLRREPSESVVESNRAREFQLIRAAATVAPVPEAYWLDESGEELGRPSIIYSYVDGVQKPSVGASKTTGVGICFNPAQRAAIGPQFIDILARIHNLDTRGADLSAFTMPRIGTTDDVDWQLNWWARVWQEDLLESVPLLTLAEQWLRANRKPLDHCSLVHADYRTGNYLFDERTLKITAMLDWELGYFGDRHLDLAWILMPAFETVGEDGSRLVSSLFSRAEFLEAYQRTSGLKVDEQRLHYYTVLVFWRGAIMTLGSALRAANGGKSHQDVVLGWFAGIGYNLLESLRRSLEAGP